jgi:hypothetical protein
MITLFALSLFSFDIILSAITILPLAALLAVSLPVLLFVLLPLILVMGIPAILISFFANVFIPMVVVPLMLVLFVGGTWGEEIWAVLVWLFEWVAGLFGGGGAEVLDGLSGALSNVII